MYASPYGVRCVPLREITPISMYSSMSSGAETMEVPLSSALMTPEHTV